MNPPGENTIRFIIRPVHNEVSTLVATTSARIFAVVKFIGFVESFFHYHSWFAFSIVFLRPFPKAANDRDGLLPGST
jgi:hypothetical protein